MKANEHNLRRFSQRTNDTGFVHICNPSDYHVRIQRLSHRRATNCKANKTQTTQNTLIHLPTRRHSKIKKHDESRIFASKTSSLTHTHSPFEYILFSSSVARRCWRRPIEDPTVLGRRFIPSPLLVRQPPHIPSSPPLTATTLPFPKIKPSTKQPLLLYFRSIPIPTQEPLGFYISSAILI